MSRRQLLLIVALSTLVLLAVLYVLELRNENRLSSFVSNSGRGDKIRAILKAIERDYVDSLNIDSIEERVLPLLVHQLDPHSEYFSAKQMEAIAEPLRGDFDGIGVTYNMITDTVIVQSVIAGGPSERAGILMGDRFLSVDGHPIVGKEVPTDSVMHLLRGPRGTTVTVGVKRQGLKDTLAIPITRARIPITSIEAAYMADEQTGVISLSRFAQTCRTRNGAPRVRLTRQWWRTTRSGVYYCYAIPTGRATHRLYRRTRTPSRGDPYRNRGRPAQYPLSSACR